MYIAANINTFDESSTTLRRVARIIGAKVRRAFELLATPYLVEGSRYL